MSALSIIFALTFFAASLVVYGSYWVFVFNRRAHEIVNRRLDLSNQLDGSSAVLETLRRERGFRDESNAVLRHCSDWLTQTGIRVDRRSLLLMLVALSLAFIFFFSTFLGIGLVSIVLGILLAAGMMFLYLSYKRSRRIFAFTEQLPDAIDIIVRGVRVGLPLSSSVSLVAREMSDPVGTEFGMLADEMAFGLDVQTAMQNLNRRVGQEDLLFLTVSLSIQTRTGGHIAEILSRLSRLMRDRAAMRLKVRALTADGRASAYFLSVFPLILIVAVNVVAPTYFDTIRSSSAFGPIVFLGIFLLIVGNVIMYRMLNFKY